MLSRRIQPCLTKATTSSSSLYGRQAQAQQQPRSQQTTTCRRQLLSYSRTPIRTISNNVNIHSRKWLSSTTTIIKLQQDYNHYHDHDHARRLFLGGSCVLAAAAAAAAGLVPTTTTTISSQTPIPSISSCEEEQRKPPLTKEQEELPTKLRKIVGADNVSVMDNNNNIFCVVAPERPNRVLECLQPIIDAGCVVVPSSGTGCNSDRGGSSNQKNNQNDDNRPVVVFSTKHLNDVIPIDGGRRVLCLAGATLSSVEQVLQQYYPHRELPSHCYRTMTTRPPTTTTGVTTTVLPPSTTTTIGAMVALGGTGGGDDSGMARRVLYVRVDRDKWRQMKPRVNNTLEIRDMYDEVRIAGAIQTKLNSALWKLDSYCQYHREKLKLDMMTSIRSKLEAPPVQQARHDDNTYPVYYKKRKEADADALLAADDVSGCEGNVLVLATVHDTVPKPRSTRTFWLGFDSLALADEFRRKVCLKAADSGGSSSVPTRIIRGCEYMNRDAFDVTDRSGRYLANLLRLVLMGEQRTLPAIQESIFYDKYVENWLPRAPPISPTSVFLVPLKFLLQAFWNDDNADGDNNGAWMDQLMYAINPCFPSVLPPSVVDTGRSMDHHVVLTVGDYGDGSLEPFLDRMNDFVETVNNRGGGEEETTAKIKIHECGTTPTESSGIDAFRLVAAPAFQTWCAGEGMEGFGVDYVLPQQQHPDNENGKKEPSLLPLEDVDQTTAVEIQKRMRYSPRFLSSDVVVAERIACLPPNKEEILRRSLKETVEAKHGGKLPAVGYGKECTAPTETRERWKRMDPLNVMNPGVGGLSSKFMYGQE